MNSEFKFKRTAAQEGTVFWLVMICLAITANIVIGKKVLGAEEVGVVVLYVVFAILCWMRIRIVFLVVPFGLAFGGIVTLVFSYQSAPAESYAVVFHALGIFYSWRAYREMKLEAKAVSMIDGKKMTTSSTSSAQEKGEGGN